MNRDYLIEVAMDAYAEASGQSVSRPWMEAAFNTIAARIWDEGWEQGMAYVTGMERGTDDDGLDHAITNPYRTKETA